LLGIDAFRGADLATVKQLTVLAAGPLKVVAGDPPESVFILGLHERFSLRGQRTESPDTAVGED
jgi:hypothetical protein